ncbi:DHS-like NAD/FAD-binding domain-containing protein [Dacryopinax primogenitus]|uniref:DHS-like NAD/FAD-binding domain-containing protein n=1 Tax=Dacryopinax primogenitus (strain DJM 731) TaxID=1858805 RepID=M5G6P2_DACPD|nr:DHS-like NAD/FAD-binding domain-containing protein [Dacryopinax primogenitus]EJU03875.1 DHS-like NAD/FAD-binding domain-containing protein [Dacryopinax primogenitus]
MVKLSVPGIPKSLSPLPSSPPIPIPQAVERVSAFLSPGNAVVLTGAGVSVDSGIRAYRGHDGRYLNPNYKPIFYQELVDPTPTGHLFRQRYWSRSYLGYPPVRDALPNPIHYSLAALQHTGHCRSLITQNVDGLHKKASPSEEVRRRILELHGTLFIVHCKHGHTWDRDSYQERLEALNPLWQPLAEKVGRELRRNPDGDVEVEGMDFASFNIPPCERCAADGVNETVIKPNVTFFGESIHEPLKDQSYRLVEEASRMLIVGTTMATYSAFRLIRHALGLDKPVLLLNVGPTRADSLPAVEKIELPAGDVIRNVAQALCATEAQTDPVLRTLLTSGVVRAAKTGDRGAG